MTRESRSLLTAFTMVDTKEMDMLMFVFNCLLGFSWNVTVNSQPIVVPDQVLQNNTKLSEKAVPHVVLVEEWIEALWSMGLEGILEPDIRPMTTENVPHFSKELSELFHQKYWVRAQGTGDEIHQLTWVKWTLIKMKVQYLILTDYYILVVCSNRFSLSWLMLYQSGLFFITKKLLTKFVSNIQFRPMIKVAKRNGESGDKLLKRFSSHAKSRKLMQKFRALRYFKQTPRKVSVREAAVMREMHRAEAKRKQFLS